MPRNALVGTRIRERRLLANVRQAELARQIGISASYLNLIEHNRRRIGGKLLADIAQALGVDAASLSGGAEAAAVEALREAAAGAQTDPAPELDRAEELAERFPGWAALVARQSRRIDALERTVANLSDRMTHDPQLAASLHELLSTVTAIRSAAAILTDTRDLEPEWRDRFHRNIYEDSQRLAETSQRLVAYLEDTGDKDAKASSPQEELEAWLAACGYHLPELERALPPDPDALLDGPGGIASHTARALGRRWLERCREDAARMPLARMTEAVRAEAADPVRVAARFGVDPAAAMRRMASLPAPDGAAPFGLAICDGSGTLTFRKPIEGFALPRFGAACPLWPLYQALARPMTPVRALVETVAGQDRPRFVAYGYAQPLGPPAYDAPQNHEATMLLVPADRDAAQAGPVVEVGSSCRVCPRAACPARREPSIMGGVADG